MSLIVIILIVLTAFALTDFLGPHNHRLHNQIYYIALFVTFFLFTIKYCYGADIAIYVPYYDELPTIRDLLHLERPDTLFEPGFNLFCFLLKSLGVSYWGMTAIISAIYFCALNKLLKKIPEYRTFALCLIVCFDYNLIFATFRQCLSVSFYILMYLAYTEKKTISMFLYMILTCVMHKSGIFFGPPTFMLLLTKDINIKKSSYTVLALLMILALILPLKSSALALANIFSLNHDLYISIDYHLSFTKKLQVVLPIYLALFMSMSLMKNKAQFFGRMNLMILLFTATIAATYQFFPLLWRLRSYFMPLIITYIFTTLYQFRQADNGDLDVSPFMTRNKKLLIPFTSALLLLFCVHTIMASQKEHIRLKSRIYEACTIFDLRQYPEEKLVQRQLSRAKRYWEYEALDKDKVKLD